MRAASVIVLAAGVGTRMKSALPKVMHAVGGRPLLGHVLRAVHQTDPGGVVVVIGHGREHVRAFLEEADPQAVVAVQEEQHGTGHAAQVGLAALGRPSGTVVVTPGDAPLLAPETILSLVRQHHDLECAVTVLTAQLADPSGYGRIVRDESGAVREIVEDRDATVAQREITECNSSVYAFDIAFLAAALAELGRDNDQGELYLTDVVKIARRNDRTVGALLSGDARETEGVNDRSQLADIGAEINRRTVRRHMLAGVTIVDPATTWVDDTVTLEPDSTVLPGVQLHGTTSVATGAVVGPDTTLTDVTVGQHATIRRTHGSDSFIGAGASVGPFAYLRPGTKLGASGKIGTFVEIKNSEIDDGAKVPHLSYIGDASIGAQTNIGAGTITANYDGVHKHRTSIGSHCATGSDNTFVAPVEVGDGAATGAGAVVRRNVPPGALAVSSGAQRHIEDWVLRKRPGTAAALAAERAQAEVGDPPARTEEAAQ